jgi:hypothetical protein
MKETTMPEPTIICPKCKTEIKLTESLAAPLIETTRREFEQRLADAANVASTR